MQSQEIRQKFLEFFKARGHVIVPSSSLIPDDPTTLFTSAGMQPMVPYLLGEKNPLGSRIVNSQRCFRSQDIEEIGDGRHTTFFEMLGNWSFGDYFKKEQLSWIFEFLTKEIHIDPRKLYVTVFTGNNEIPRDLDSVAIWKNLFKSVGIDALDKEDPETKGLQGGRIFYYGEKKNWWSLFGPPSEMPAGEIGGPDSEMFYEFTDLPHNITYGPHCHPNCDCGRFMEIGNSVFIEYIKKEDSTFEPLPIKNIDFGGGLERLAAASENTPDIFRIDAFLPLIQKIEKQTGKKYDIETARSMGIMCDHAKASVMLLGDGVRPSNKAQGYVLRRLIRRAIRFIKKLEASETIFAQIAETALQMYISVYPELAKKQKDILEA